MSAFFGRPNPLEEVNKQAFGSFSFGKANPFTGLQPPLTLNASRNANFDAQNAPHAQHGQASKGAPFESFNAAPSHSSGTPLLNGKAKASDPLDQVPSSAPPPQRMHRGPANLSAPPHKPPLPPQTPKGSAEYKKSPLSQSPMNRESSSDRSSSPAPPVHPAQPAPLPPTQPKQPAKAAVEQQQRKPPPPHDLGGAAEPSAAMPQPYAGRAPQKRKDEATSSTTEVPNKKIRTQSQSQTAATPATQAQPAVEQRNDSPVENLGPSVPCQQVAVPPLSEADLDWVPQKLVEYIMAWSSCTAVYKTHAQHQDLKIAELTEVKHQTEKSNDAFKTLRAQWRRTIDEKIEEIDRVNYMWQEHRRSYEASIRTMNDEHTKASREIKPARDFANNKENGPEALLAQLASVKFQLSEIKRDHLENVAAKEIAAKMVERAHEAERRVTEVQSELSSLQQVQEATGSVLLSTTKEQLHKLEEDYKAVKDELESLKQKSIEDAKAAAVEAVQLKTALEGESKRLSDKEELLSKQEESLADLKKRNNDLRIIANKMSEKDSELARLREQLEELISKQVSEKQELEVKLKEAEDSHAECGSKLDDAIRQLGAKEEELKAAFKQEGEVKAELEKTQLSEAKLRDAVDHFGNVEKQLGEAKVEVDAEKTKVKELQQQLDDSKAELEQKEVEWASTLKNTEKSHQGKHDDVLSSFKTDIKKLRSELKQEKEAVTSIRQELQTSTSAHQNAKKENHALTMQMQTLNRELAEIKASLKRSQDDSERLLKEEKEKRKELENSATHKDSAFERLAERYEKGYTNVKENEVIAALLRRAEEKHKAMLDGVHAELEKLKEDHQELQAQALEHEMLNLVDSPVAKTKDQGKTKEQTTLVEDSDDGEGQLPVLQRGSRTSVKSSTSKTGSKTSAAQRKIKANKNITSFSDDDEQGTTQNAESQNQDSLFGAAGSSRKSNKSKDQRGGNAEDNTVEGAEEGSSNTLMEEDSDGGTTQQTNKKTTTTYTRKTKNKD